MFVVAERNLSPPPLTKTVVDPHNAELPAPHSMFFSLTLSRTAALAGERSPHFSVPHHLTFICSCSTEANRMLL